MRSPLQHWGVPAAVGAAGAVIEFGILATLRDGYTIIAVVYVLANLVVFTDFFDFVLRLYLRRAQSAGGARATSIALPTGGTKSHAPLRPYAIVVSVHNAENAIDGFLDSLHAYRDRCWIIDDASSDDTVERIRHAGWRCLEGVQNRKKPGAIRRLLRALPPEIETVMVIDPDISLDDIGHPGSSHLETVVREFQQSGMAAVSPRLAVRPQSFLQRFQALEYGMSFSLGRMSLADCGINSGISMYRRSALAAVLDEHSLSVYAEDLENSLILLGAGEQIYYDSRLVVATDVPASLYGWFSQRVGWTFGLMKVYVERFDEVLRVARRRPRAAYQFLVYIGISCIAMQPFKIVGLVLLSLGLANALDGLLGLGWIPQSGVSDPIYFVAAYVKYTLLACAALVVSLPRREWGPVLPILPLYFFYALLQLVPTTIGFANWINLRVVGSRLFADHYQDEDSLRREHALQPSRPVARGAR